ncbi:hypothetical protein DEJ00_08465 [Curtobacterium sp. MCLR17_039]|uniref:JmjC domain-containing protein n=1 Tax=Curtobacterium sp. MCLR17_039 TaxID=2175624 RepID=UPI000DA82BB7|nr:cupin domain-containing protein [Curtobacterium sp. MCLR17_039]PZE90780.1 hypothetical protein DEJ00_08465 [Curtobacterium sp. MCLR17_039]
MPQSAADPVAQYEQIGRFAAVIASVRDQREPWSTATIAADAVAVLRAEVERQLAHPISLGVRERRLAYAQPDALIYPTSEEEAAALWAAGKTAIMQSLQTEPGPINQLAAELQVAVSRRVSCSVYLSAADAESFDFHVDEWDGALVQLSGTKTFAVLTDAGEIAEVRIGAGDLLFLPQGRKHKALSSSGSMHLSVNFLPD